MSERLTTQCVGVDFGLPTPIQQIGDSYFARNPFHMSFSKEFDVITAKNHVKISDVKILSPNKVVQVIFEDGTSEKAVCSKEDDFSLEIGITICLAKKFLGGTKKYNSTIRKALKIIENKEKLKQQAEEEKSRILKRQQKRKEYLAKREQKRREEEIKIREEAYYRAMKRMESEKEK